MTLYFYIKDGAIYERKILLYRRGVISSRYFYADLAVLRQDRSLPAGEGQRAERLSPVYVRPNSLHRAHQVPAKTRPAPDGNPHGIRRRRHGTSDEATNATQRRSAKKNRSAAGHGRYDRLVRIVLQLPEGKRLSRYPLQEDL